MLGFGLSLSIGNPLLASVSAGAPLPATASDVTAYERAMPDATWSWHINDRAIWDSTTGRTYLTSAAMADGSQYINVLDQAGVYQSRVTVGDSLFDPDDHNAPAIVLHNGQLFCAYSGHNDNQYIYIRRSTDTTPENLGAPVTVNVGTTQTSYAQFAVVDGSLYLAARTGNEGWTMWRWDGTAWTGQRTISTSATQTYINLRSSGTALRYIAWDHPTNATEPTLGEVYARQFAPTDNSAALSSLGSIYSPASGRGARVLDVLPTGAAVLLADFDLSDLTDQSYLVLTYSGGGDYDDPAEWTATTAGSNAYAFWASSNYVPGGCFANASGTAIWLCESATDGSTVMSLKTRSGGTWSGSVVAQSGLPLARPVCDPAAGPRQCYVQRIGNYVDFNDLVSDVFPIYATDDIPASDFLEPITGVRAYQVEQYFDAPDLQSPSWTIDLSSAQAGDTVVVCSVQRSTGTTTMSLGGTAMSIAGSTTGDGWRSYAYTLPYSDGMGGTLQMTSADVPSYQKLICAIVTGGYAQQGVGSGPTFAADDLVVGICTSSNDASATHAWTPDVSVSRVLHGASTVISCAAGVASGAGTVGVTGKGFNSQTYAIVMRPS